MGWFSYSIYGGDETQSRHVDFIKWSGVKVPENDIYLEWQNFKGTKIPDEHLTKFVQGIPKILKKMPKRKYWSDDDAIEWQMLAALLEYNNIYDSYIFLTGLEATRYLMGEHAADFDNPSRRRAALKRFHAKISKRLQ